MTLREIIKEQGMDGSYILQYLNFLGLTPEEIIERITSPRCPWGNDGYYERLVRLIEPYTDWGKV
jgi:hypothetical protein